MKAAVYHGNRDIRVESMPEPAKPGLGEVLLEVVRGAICGTDVTEYLHGPHFIPLHERHTASGHLGPTIVGHEFVGRIVAVGSDVSGFNVGQRVVPGAGASCGACAWCLGGRTNLCERYFTLGLQTHGGLAEMAAVPAGMCRPVPDGCGDEAAAMAQPLAVALHAVRRSKAVPGQTIALMGVGGIGSFILAAARAQGLGPVIAIDIDERRLETARKLGATHLVNARREDPVRAITRLTDGVGVHVFIEASGAPQGPGSALAGTRRGGQVLLVGLPADPPALDLHSAVIREVQLTTTVAHICDIDLPDALNILSATPLGATVLDRVIELGALIDEGILALAESRARGKVVVRLSA